MPGDSSQFLFSRQVKDDPLRFSLIFVALWTVASVVAVLVLHRIRVEVSLEPWAWLTVGVAALSATVFESLLVVLLIALLKRLVSSCASIANAHFQGLARGLCFALMSVLFIALCFTVMAIVMSWNFASHQLNFLTVSVVNSALFDVVTLAPFLSGREIFSIVVGIVLSGLFVGVLFWLTPRANYFSLKKLSAVSFGAATLAVVALRVVPEIEGERVNKGRIRTAFESYTLPSMTLYWGPLIFFQKTQDSTNLRNLAPIQDLKAYSAQIDRSVKRKNIIIFAIEALRADEIGQVYNDIEITPTLNYLAKIGINFTKAYSTGNESAYAMTSAVSGLLPLKFAKRDRFKDVDYPVYRIYDVLSPVYHTAFVSSANEDWQNMIGITKSASLDFFFHAPLFQGTALPVPQADTGLRKAVAKGKLSTGKLDDGTTIDTLTDWISRVRKESSDKPFIAFVSLQSSHYPYQQGFNVPGLFRPYELTPEEESKLSFFNYPAELADKMRNRYRNSIHYSDYQIGRAVDFLKQNGLFEDTIVVAFGDHGELFHENGAVTHAAKLYNKSLHIALVMAGADKYRQGTYDAPVSLLDLNPMLLDAVDFPDSGAFQGRVPPGLDTLQPDEIEQFYPVFSTVQNIADEDSVMLGRWKYVANPLETVERFYNVAEDPLENENLIDRQEHSRRIACLRETLRDFRVRQIAYYRSAEIHKSFFPPRHRMAGFYCDPSML